MLILRVNQIIISIFATNVAHKKHGVPHANYTAHVLTRVIPIRDHRTLISRRLQVQLIEFKCILSAY
jgi:hypothetical protein